MDRIKKLMIGFLLITLILGATFIDRLHAQNNLIINGDFELVNKDWADSWTKQGRDETELSISIDDEIYYSGKNSAKINPVDDTWKSIRHPDISVVPGEIYKLTFYWKYENITEPDKLFYHFGFKDESSTWLSGKDKEYLITAETAGNMDWTKQEITFEAPSDAKYISYLSVQFAKNSSEADETVWIDDFELTQLEMTDEERVKKVLEEINLPEAPFIIEDKIELPAEGLDGTNIDWHSNNEEIIDKAGIVNRPPFGKGSVDVTLTASVTIGDVTDSKEFTLHVVDKIEEAVFEISGDTQIEIPKKETIKETYSAVIKDKNGDVVEEPFKWELAEEYKGITIDQSTGEIVVDQHAEAGIKKLKVVLDRNKDVFGEFEILLLSRLTIKQELINDKQVKVEIKANGLKDVYAYELVLHIDEEILDQIVFQSMLEGSGYTLEPTMENKRLYLGYTSIGKDSLFDNIQEDGIIAELTFNVKEHKAVNIELEKFTWIDSKLTKIIEKYREDSGEEPEEGVPGEEPKEEVPGEEPEEEVPGEEPEEEVPGEEPEEEVPGEEPEEEVPGEEPEEDSGESLGGNRNNDKDQDQIKENDQAKNEIKDTKLPHTATSNYSVLLVGIVLLIIGAITMVIIRRKRLN